MTRLLRAIGYFRWTRRWTRQLLEKLSGTCFPEVPRSDRVLYRLYFAKMAARYKKIQNTEYAKSTSYTQTIKNPMLVIGVNKRNNQPAPSKTWFPWLTGVCALPPEKQHLDRLSRFCTAHHYHRPSQTR